MSERNGFIAMVLLFLNRKGAAVCDGVQSTERFTCLKNQNQFKRILLCYSIAR